MKKMAGNITEDRFDLVEPRASAMVESLRAFGYDLATALADLADNSLFHHSRNLSIHFHWAGDKSAIALADDGDGMDEPTLINAMRLGSRNPRETRDPGDFGRFGLGLKTASFSQCRRVTVITKQRGGENLIRCWDLDHIADTDKWQLLRTPSALASKLAEKLAYPKQGTVVILEKLDRLTADTAIENDVDEDAFLIRAEQVGEHFAAVFHRLMIGRNSVAFTLNGKKILPWDPFLADEDATQRLREHTWKCWRGQRISSLAHDYCCQDPNLVFRDASICEATELKHRDTALASGLLSAADSPFANRQILKTKKVSEADWVELQNSESVETVRLWIAQQKGYFDPALNLAPRDYQTILEKNPDRFSRTGRIQFVSGKARRVYKENETSRLFYVDEWHPGESAHMEVFDSDGTHLGEADITTGVVDLSKKDSSKRITF